jgi:HPt (histidine-containing phosphotransfer) domain-containing protein
VPPELADLAPDYLTHRRKEARALERSLRQGDFEELRRIAHAMRGSGGSYGFPVISVIGRMLEDAAERRDAQLARCWSAKLQSHLARVEIVAA